MKKEELIEKGLTEDQAKAVMEIYTEEMKGYIPKSRFDEVNTAKADLEKQVADLVRRAIQRAGQDSRGDQTSLEMEFKQLCQRREAALDAFLARLITEPEMRQMVNRYDGEIERIQKKLDDAREQWGAARELVEVEQKIRALVQGEQVSEAFYKDLLDHLVVYPGGKISVKLKYLPQRWSFVLGEEPGELGQNDPSVPISVSSPFASG